VKGLITLFRDFLRLRLFVCLNFVFAIILIAGAQAQAQPGSGSSEAAASPTKTNAVPPDQRVVLKVGDLQITQAAFEQYLADLEAQQGPADLSRKQLGDNYASMLMLSKMAAANHLDQTPPVQRQLAVDRMQILSNAEFANLKTQTAPSKNEIQAYYNAHLDDYDVVEMRRLFIWVGDAKNGGQLTPERAKALADAVSKVYASGGGQDRLQKLVKETPHNNDEIVIDEQPLTFQRGELPGNLDETAFSLKPGEWKEMNNGPNAYLFIQVVNRSRKDLSQVSGQIEKKLQTQKLKAELEGLKKKTGIWMDETYFVSKPPMPKFQERD
jgi:hypothetical protein